MNNIQHITVEQLQQRMAGGEDLLLLDVREDFERELFNIGGMHIPLAEVLNKAAEIPTNKPVIVYCRKGIRSQIAIQKLQERFGYDNLVNLQGGVEGINW
jgi:adenylyltransferase/sulfurtransferase